MAIQDVNIVSSTPLVVSVVDFNVNQLQDMFKTFMQPLQQSMDDAKDTLRDIRDDNLKGLPNILNDIKKAIENMGTASAGRPSSPSGPAAPGSTVGIETAINDLGTNLSDKIKTLTDKLTGALDRKERNLFSPTEAFKKAMVGPNQGAGAYTDSSGYDALIQDLERLGKTEADYLASRLEKAVMTGNPDLINQVDELKKIMMKIAKDPEFDGLGFEAELAKLETMFRGEGRYGQFKAYLDQFDQIAQSGAPDRIKIMSELLRQINQDIEETVDATRDWEDSVENVRKTLFAVSGIVGALSFQQIGAQAVDYLKTTRNLGVSIGGAFDANKGITDQLRSQVKQVVKYSDGLVQAEDVLKGQQALWEQGLDNIEEFGDMLKISSTTAQEMGISFEESVEFTGDISFNLRMSGRQAAMVLRSVSKISKQFGLSAKMVMETQRNLKDTLETIRNIQGVTSGVVNEITRMGAAAEKFRAGDITTDITKNLSSFRNFLEMDDKQRLATILVARRAAKETGLAMEEIFAGALTSTPQRMQILKESMLGMFIDLERQIEQFGETTIGVQRQLEIFGFQGAKQLGLNIEALSEQMRDPSKRIDDLLRLKELAKIDPVKFSIESEKMGFKNLTPDLDAVDKKIQEFKAGAQEDLFGSIKGILANVDESYKRAMAEKFEKEKLISSKKIIQFKKDPTQFFDEFNRFRQELDPSEVARVQAESFNKLLNKSALPEQLANAVKAGIEIPGLENLASDSTNKKIMSDVKLLLKEVIKQPKLLEPILAETFQASAENASKLAGFSSDNVVDAINKGKNLAQLDIMKAQATFLDSINSGVYKLVGYVGTMAATLAGLLGVMAVIKGAGVLGIGAGMFGKGAGAAAAGAGGRAAAGAGSGLKGLFGKGGSLGFSAKDLKGVAVGVVKGAAVLAILAPALVLLGSVILLLTGAVAKVTGLNANKAIEIGKTVGAILLSAGIISVATLAASKGLQALGALAQTGYAVMAKQMLIGAAALLVIAPAMVFLGAAILKIGQLITRLFGFDAQVADEVAKTITTVLWSFLKITMAVAATSALMAGMGALLVAAWGGPQIAVTLAALGAGALGLAILVPAILGVASVILWSANKVLRVLGIDSKMTRELSETVTSILWSFMKITTVTAALAGMIVGLGAMLGAAYMNPALMAALTIGAIGLPIVISAIVLLGAIVLKMSQKATLGLSPMVVENLSKTITSIVGGLYNITWSMAKMAVLLTGIGAMMALAFVNPVFMGLLALGATGLLMLAPLMVGLGSAVIKLSELMTFNVDGEKAAKSVASVLQAAVDITSSAFKFMGLLTTMGLLTGLLPVLIPTILLGTAALLAFGPAMTTLASAVILISQGIMTGTGVNETTGARVAENIASIIGAAVDIIESSQNILMKIAKVSLLAAFMPFFGVATIAIMALTGNTILLAAVIVNMSKKFMKSIGVTPEAAKEIASNIDGVIGSAVGIIENVQKLQRLVPTKSRFRLVVDSFFGLFVENAEEAFGRLMKSTETIVLKVMELSETLKKSTGKTPKEAAALTKDISIIVGSVIDIVNKVKELQTKLPSHGIIYRITHMFHASVEDSAGQLLSITESMIKLSNNILNLSKSLGDDLVNPADVEEATDKVRNVLLGALSIVSLSEEIGKHVSKYQKGVFGKLWTKITGIFSDITGIVADTPEDSAKELKNAVKFIFGVSKELVDIGGAANFDIDKAKKVCDDMSMMSSALSRIVFNADLMQKTMPKKGFFKTIVSFFKGSINEEDIKELVGSMSRFATSIVQIAKDKIPLEAAATEKMMDNVMATLNGAASIIKSFSEIEQLTKSQKTGGILGWVTGRFTKKEKDSPMFQGMIDMVGSLTEFSKNLDEVMQDQAFKKMEERIDKFNKVLTKAYSSFDNFRKITQSKKKLEADLGKEINLGALLGKSDMSTIKTAMTNEEMMSPSDIYMKTRVPGVGGSNVAVRETLSTASEVSAASPVGGSAPVDWREMSGELGGINKNTSKATRLLELIEQHLKPEQHIATQGEQVSGTLHPRSPNTRNSLAIPTRVNSAQQSPWVGADPMGLSELKHISSSGTG